MEFSVFKAKTFEFILKRTWSTTFLETIAIETEENERTNVKCNLTVDDCWNPPLVTAVCMVLPVLGITLRGPL